MKDLPYQPRHIKTIYKYFDEQHGVWNLFVFVECCSIYFCVHRVHSNIDQYVHTYERDGCSSIGLPDKLYVFENARIVNESIHRLKEKLSGKMIKVNITKTAMQHLKCLTCFSCTSLGFLIECAYSENPDNILQHGIHATYRYIWSDNEGDYWDLADSVQKSECILHTETDLCDKVYSYIQEYDVPVNYFQDEFECNIKGCTNDTNVYFCKTCLTYNLQDKPLRGWGHISCYNLCQDHFTEEHIRAHYANDSYADEHGATCTGFIHHQQILDDPTYATQANKRLWQEFYHQFGGKL